MGTKELLGSQSRFSLAILFNQSFHLLFAADFIPLRSMDPRKKSIIYEVLTTLFGILLIQHPLCDGKIYSLFVLCFIPSPQSTSSAAEWFAHQLLRLGSASLCVVNSSEKQAEQI